MIKAPEEYSLILKIRALASRNPAVLEWLEECFKAVREEAHKSDDLEGLEAAVQMILLLRPQAAIREQNHQPPVPLLPPATTVLPMPTQAETVETEPPLPPTIVKDGRLSFSDFNGRAYNQWFRWRIAQVMRGATVGGAYLEMPSVQIIPMVETPLLKAGILKPQRPFTRNTKANISRQCNPWRPAIGQCLLQMAQEGSLVQVGLRRYRWAGDN